MSTNAITPRFADKLCSLAESPLQAQVSRSGTLDAGALVVMAVDSAVAAIAALILAARSADHLWIAALVLLALSLGLAIRSLSLPGASHSLGLGPCPKIHQSSLGLRPTFCNKSAAKQAWTSADLL